MDSNKFSTPKVNHADTELEVKQAQLKENIQRGINSLKAGNVTDGKIVIDRLRARVKVGAASPPR